MFNNTRFMFPGTIFLLSWFSRLSYPRKFILIALTLTSRRNYHQSLFKQARFLFL